MDACDQQGVWWRSLVHPRPLIFVLLIIAGLSAEIGIHYLLGITIVYTQFFYLIIVVAGLWYGKKAIWVALFFGGLHILVTFLITGVLSPDAVARAIIMLVVASVIGVIVDQTRCYYARINEQNQELNDANEEMRCLNDQLTESEAAFQAANRKLHLLSSITRHDIRNQLMGLMGFNELAREKCTDPELRMYLERVDQSAQTILHQIEFTRTYEDIGIRAPAWQNLESIVSSLNGADYPDGFNITSALNGIEILADPLLAKVFENMIDNSRRHGEHVRQISFSYIRLESGEVRILYVDDGVGVKDVEKEKIFLKGFGKHTGLGLFLSREILAITGLSIRETGIYGKGVRFEIQVPEGKYRFPGEAATGNNHSQTRA